MLPLIVVLWLILAVPFCGGYSRPSNEFEATVGCQQLNVDNNYFKEHHYMDTSRFKNVNSTDGVTRMRFGVLGKHNAYVRFSSASTNCDTPMTEIALAHWWNARSDVQKYTRTIPKGLNSKNLAPFIKKGLMGIFKPVMITMEIHRGGFVTITRDGEYAPFLQFNDPTFSYKYMGVAKWDDPVVLFYDCPLLAEDGSMPGSLSSCNNCLEGVTDKCSWLAEISSQLSYCSIDPRMKVHR